MAHWPMKRSTIARALAKSSVPWTTIRPSRKTVTLVSASTCNRTKNRVRCTSPTPVQRDCSASRLGGGGDLAAAICTALRPQSEIASVASACPCKYSKSLPTQAGQFGATSGGRLTARVLLFQKSTAITAWLTCCRFPEIHLIASVTCMLAIACVAEPRTPAVSQVSTMPCGGSSGTKQRKHGLVDPSNRRT